MKNKTTTLFPILALMLVSMACAGSGLPALSTPTAVVNAQATFQALTAAVPTITPRPAITFAPLPFTVEPTFTPTSAPTSDVNLSFAQTIYFVTGATSASVVGDIKADHAITYSLYVVGNQPAQISLGSQNNDVTMSIYDPAKTELLSPTLKSNSWQGYFKKAGTYYIKVYGGAGESKFNLSISISARVTLPSDITAIKIKSRTVGGGIISYVVKANKDQTMEVTINTQAEAAALTIWGFTDGQPYVRAAAGTTTFSMQIPTTQDYIIDVVPQNGKVVNYVLNISIK